MQAEVLVNNLKVLGEKRQRGDVLSHDDVARIPPASFSAMVDTHMLREFDEPKGGNDLARLFAQNERIIEQNMELTAKVDRLEQTVQQLQRPAAKKAAASRRKAPAAK